MFCCSLDIVKNCANFSSESNSWEPAESVSQCKTLLEEFEKNLAKQKEMKAQQQKLTTTKPLVSPRTVVKAETVKPGPSTAMQAG